ncbi:LuxR C-terminal-related transcriptional regulator [Streptomyces sp. NPDC093094]|uniref:helix-turn-helix transcriptional regulator n=1 Tax=Streptomyces sp. NPDC093094 TaxID=3366026 RepID=UPI00381BED25
MATAGNEFQMSPDAARGFLRDQLDWSRRGNGRLVMVSGGIASGKSHLQNDLFDHAEELGCLTLSATGAPDEQGIGASAIDQLVANSPHPLGIRTGDDRADPQYLRDVCDTLLGLAREKSLVIGIDDLHFVDETSLRLLLQLHRRIRSTNLLIVLNQPDWRQSPFTRLSANFARQLRYYSVHLTPLSECGVESLLKEALDGDADDGAAARIHELGAGNPMLVRALIEDHRTAEHTGQATVGAAYVRAVRALLDRPDTEPLEVAAALAVLDGPGVPEHLADLTDVHPQGVVRLLDALERCGLLSDGDFRHPLARTAVLDSLAPARRTRLHEAAARMKHRAGSPATEVARHLVAADTRPAPWAVPVLRQAADQALSANDGAFARQVLGLALTAAADPDEERVIHQSLVWSTWRVNPARAAAHIPALRAAADTGTLDHDGCFALMRHALWHGDRALFDQAHRIVTGSAEPVDPRTEAELGLAHTWYFGPTTGRRDEDEPAVRPRSTPWAEITDALKHAWGGAGSEATLASAERILQNCGLSNTSLEALATAVTALTVGGRGGAAEQWCVRLDREARRQGAVTWQAVLEALRACILLQRDEITEAAERARAALELLGEQGWGISIGDPLAILVYADISAGNFNEAARTLRIPVPDAMFDTMVGLRYLRARGHFHLATRRPLAAVSDFQRCEQLLRDWDDSVLAPIPWRSDLAEAHLQLGNTETARELAKQQIKLSMESDPYACGLALRVLAYTSSPSDDHRLLGRAAKVFEDAGNRLEVSRTLRSIARLQEQRQGPAAGAVRDPRARLPRQAALPARPVAAPLKRIDITYRPDDEAHKSGQDEPRPAHPAVLSEAELRVAQLAVRGYTNREISSRLFVTVSTVEQHLTRAYRKLGIRGRQALADELRLRHPG